MKKKSFAYLGALLIAGILMFASSLPIYSEPIWIATSCGPVATDTEYYESLNELAQAQQDLEERCREMNENEKEQEMKDQKQSATIEDNK